MLIVVSVVVVVVVACLFALLRVASALKQLGGPVEPSLRIGQLVVGVDL